MLRASWWGVVWVAAWPQAALYAAEADDHKKVDRLFAAYDKPGSPGCALGVIRDGNFIYRKAYGMASLELGVPLSSRSVFYMGSVSKQFTAASVVLAAEQGFLSLEDPLRKYVPEFPDYGQPITLRQMLHHTSGIRDFYTLLALAGRSRYDHQTPAEVIDLITRQKALNFEPGSRYSYSNSNYLLLAEVIKRATGKPLSAFSEENIFRPLGMKHTRFYDDNSVVLPDRVSGYSSAADGRFQVNWSTNFDLVGAGGLMSSIDDMLLWDRNFYRNRIGGSTFLKEMQTKGVLNDGQESSYALGLLLYPYRGVPVVEHAGGNFGYVNETLRFPEQRFSVITLCNVSSANPIGLSFQVADLYLGKVLQPMPPPATPAAASPVASPVKQPEPPHPDPTALAAYAGVFKSAELDAIYRFAVEDGNLMLRSNWNPVLKLTPLAPDTFSTEDGYYKLTFRKGSKGQVCSFTISSYVVSNIGFDKIG